MTTTDRRRWPASPLLARLVWLGLAGLAGVAGVEILLQYRVAVKEAFARDDSRMEELRRAYAAFGVQHLHPYYMFFFPLTVEGRAAIGNAVCSIDREGFREPGPAHANSRKLAYLLGGSAAFGDFASSNATTITSYMNAMQAEYFFVNAGVPSWSSTQELVRMAVELAAQRPALVITYDGANDAALAGEVNPVTGATYPAGAPEGFDELDNLMNASPRWRRPTIASVLPEIGHRAAKYRAAIFGREPEPPIAITRVEAAVTRYLANLEQIAALSRAAGARYVSVFQPIATLHRNVPASFVTPDDFDGFHAMVAARARTFESHDLSAFFDQHFAEVPVAVPDVTSETVFVDGVHLHDRGNELVARHLLRLIGQDPVGPPAP